jgi:hypothetical protein
MTLFDDFKQQGPLFKQLEDDGLIRKAFDKEVIEELINWGWYEELYDDDGPDFDSLEKLPVYFVYVLEHKRQSIEMLVNAYEPLAAVKAAGHFVDFLLVDAGQNLVCGLGLGRKNRMFITYSNDGAEFKHDDANVKEMMTSALPWDVLTKLQTTLDDVGQEIFQRDSIPGNLEILEELLSNGPNEDGSFYLEDSAEELSEQELRSRIAHYEMHTENIEDAESVFSAIFPAFEITELSTGDY